jgi:predicted phage terminase large subunit-like protein
MEVEKAREIILSFQNNHSSELKDKILFDPTIATEIVEFEEYVLDNKWIPFNPQPRQACFLADKHKEILFGGAARGGKSIGLLMCALRYVDIPGYAALVLTSTLEQSKQNGGIIDMSKAWDLEQKGANYNNTSYCWTFPSGAKIQFGYLTETKNLARYKSTNWSLICFDELTNFGEEDFYTYLFSRLSQSVALDIPSQMRCASNPDGIGHVWVKNRFINSFDPDRLYMPARLGDNYGENRREYRINLSKLSPIIREQLENGNWDVTRDGQMFQLPWFERVEKVPGETFIIKTARFWDLAATSARKGADPDYTVGTKMGVGADGKYYILDVQRFRDTPGTVRAKIRFVAELDGPDCFNFIEQEGGASGVEQAENYAKEVFKGLKFKAIRSTINKVQRAELFSSACENHLVSVIIADWNEAFFNELSIFPIGAHDDQVDATASCFNALQEEKKSIAYTLRW